MIKIRQYGLILLVGWVILAGGWTNPMAASSPNVVLIGIDAAEWDVINTLSREGKLPNFTKLLNHGVHGDLETIRPILSPMIWSVIGTGYTPYQIMENSSEVKDRQFVYSRDYAKVKLHSRTVPAIWDILGYHKKSVVVCSWIGMYPAEKVLGADICDYNFLSPKTGIPVKENGYYPPTIKAMIAKDVVAPRSVTDKQLMPFVNLPKGMNLKKAESKYGEKFNEIRWSYGQNESVTRIGLELYKKYSPDFFTMYWEGIDTMGHALWYYSRFNKNPPPAYVGVITPEDQVLFSQSIESFYQYTDQLLGRVMKTVDKNSIIIIVSDHGFGEIENMKSLPGEGESRVFHKNILSIHKDKGVFIASAPYLKVNKTVSGARVYDVTPTILTMMGLPIDRQMAGKPLVDAIDPIFLQKHPVSMVDSYKKMGLSRQDISPGKVVPLDRDAEERMKAIGYLN